MPASVSAAEGNWTGSGTTSDPYLIEDAADLEELSNTLTASQAYSGKYFKVTDDIEVSGWNPIGSSSSASFKGIFDGDGHTITINGIDPDYGQTVSTYYAGLFGYLKGSVYNVTVDGQIFSDKGYAYIGGIAGYYAADYSAVHIVNCVNLAEISLSGNYSYAGGIVGYVNSNYDYLYNCYNGGSVSASGNGSKSG